MPHKSSSLSASLTLLFFHNCCVPCLPLRPLVLSPPLFTPFLRQRKIKAAVDFLSLDCFRISYMRNEDTIQTPPSHTTFTLHPCYHDLPHHTLLFLLPSPTSSCTSIAILTHLVFHQPFCNFIPPQPPSHNGGTSEHTCSPVVDLHL